MALRFGSGVPEVGTTMVGEFLDWQAKSEAIKYARDGHETIRTGHSVIFNPFILRAYSHEIKTTLLSNERSKRSKCIIVHLV